MIPAAIAAHAAKGGGETADAPGDEG
jgi:hypothetical protein